MKSRFLLVLMVLALLVAPSVTTRAQTPQTLEIYITGLTEGTLNWFREVAFPAFQAQHAGVNLEILTGGWGDFDATVAGWITTGAGPDIVYLGSEYAATYGPLLANLDPYLADWADLDQFLPAAIETVTWDGHLRGLPLLMSPRPMFYRTDLAADPAAIPPLTFADSLAFVAANSQVEGGAMARMGFMDIGSGLFDAQEFIAYIWSAGGELYYEDGTSAFDSPETAAAMQFMYDRRRIMMPTDTTAGLPPFEGYPIASNLVVSGIFPMWNMPPVSDPLWENIAIAPYPAGPDGEPVVQVFIDWLSVPSYVADPALAVEFLKFIGSRENAIELSRVAGFTPTRSDAWDEIREASAVWDRMLDVTVEYGRAFSDIRASAELRPLIFEQMGLFLSDAQSLEDTQRAMKEEYDAILADQGYLN
jgi:multiple sugar transport system substrate-binding protein